MNRGNGDQTHDTTDQSDLMRYWEKGLSREPRLGQPGPWGKLSPYNYYFEF